MGATQTFGLAVVVFLSGSFVFGTLEGFAYGYWDERTLEGRWLLAFLEDWWFYAGYRLLPASVVALLAFRFCGPVVQQRLRIPASWWGRYLLLVICFAVSACLAWIWGFMWSMPLAFLLSIGCVAAVLRLEGPPRRAAA